MHLSYVVRFTDSLRVIQDLRLGNLIGAGERRDRIYFFRKILTVHVVYAHVLFEFELWHNRLGHPSRKVLKLVLVIGEISFQKKLNKACVVCAQAKQTCDCFPIRDSKSECIFALIHCDLWGPYRTTSFCDATYFLTLVDDYSRSIWVYLLCAKT